MCDSLTGPYLRTRGTHVAVRRVPVAGQHGNTLSTAPSFSPQLGYLVSEKGLHQMLEVGAQSIPVDNSQQRTYVFSWTVQAFYVDVFDWRVEACARQVQLLGTRNLPQVHCPTHLSCSLPVRC